MRDGKTGLLNSFDCACPISLNAFRFERRCAPSFEPPAVVAEAATWYYVLSRGYAIARCALEEFEILGRGDRYGARRDHERHADRQASNHLARSAGAARRRFAQRESDRRDAC